jgi:hypothetical protein
VTSSDKHGAIERALGEAGHGPVLERVGLNGELVLGPTRCSTSLCRTPSGLWLVGVPSQGSALLLDLLAPERTLRYVEGLLGARIEVDGHKLGVPRGRGEQILRLIAQARITRHFGTGSHVVDEPRATGAHGWVAPLVEPLDAEARHFLRHFLAPGERLLAWLSTDDVRAFTSRLGGESSAPIVVVVTDLRQALVALSRVGDVWIAELPREPLRVRAQLGRDLVRIAGHELHTTLTNEAAFAAIAELRADADASAPSSRFAQHSLTALDSGERLHQHALALHRWAHRNLVGAVDASLERRVAAALAELPDDPFATLALVLVVEPACRAASEPGPRELDARFFAALQALVARETDAADLLDWQQAWSIGPELGELLVEHLCELGEAGLRLALPLHEQVRPLVQAQLEVDDEAAALLDFVLVEHLLALGEPAQVERARELLELRRVALPSEALQDLLPSSAEHGGQRIRIELHELLVEVHRRAGRVDDELDALAELARLQPLVRERIAALVSGLEARAGSLDASRSALLVRAREVRALLDGRAFASPPTPAPGNHDSLAASSLAEQERELLRHPAARVDGVLGRLQGALAKVAVPDCSVLKSYCARANLAREAELAAAVADASLLLGLGAVEVFVSRGDKSIGLRAYEGNPPFMLIGGDHLDRESDAHLDGPALRHAIAAELAHLRFAHSRVTSDEVWAGTLDLGLTGLGVLVAAAPLLKRFQAPAKHLLDKIGAPALARWRKRLSDDQHARALGSENSELIAAHRVMQLTADRAGLLACSDPRGAIVAMFRVHPSYLSQWPIVVRRGLHDALIRELRADDERERIRLEDLAVRVAALLSFYLSDDYARLHAAAWSAGA